MPAIPNSKDREIIRHLPIRGNTVSAAATLSLSGNNFLLSDVVSSSASPSTQTVFIIRSNPNDFIDTWTSALSFKLRVSSPSLQGVYMHAFHSLIKDIRIEAANGTELERIDDVHVLNSFIGDALFGKNYRNNGLFSTRVRETSHTGFTAKESATAPNSIVSPYNTVDELPYTDASRESIEQPAYNTGDEHDVLIPLSFLCGLFRMDTLMPPQLAEGLKIFITWNEAKDVFTYNINTLDTAFTTVTGPPDLNANIGLVDGTTFANNLIDTSYFLTAVELHLDTQVVTNQIAESVMKVFQSSYGIDIPFRTYTTFEKAKQFDCLPRVSTTISFEVPSSFSQASKFLGTFRYRSPTDVNNNFIPLLNQDQPFDEFFTFQTRHNQKSYPRRPLTGSVSQFWEWQKAFGANKILYNTNRTSYDDFITQNGTSFVYDMNRSTRSYTQTTAGSNICANPWNSTQTIDGNNRLSVTSTIPSPDDADAFIKRNYPSDLYTSEKALPDYIHALAWTWIEHYRHINLSSAGIDIKI